MNFIAQALSESGGKASSHRLMMCFACVTILGVWAGVSIARQELQPMSPEQTLIVLGALGIQAWKRGVESGSGSGSKQQEPKGTT